MDTPEGPLGPETESALPAGPVVDRRAIVTQGLIWTGMLQVFLVGANFVSMLVLVRLLSPAEYGRAAAATGVLALINCFNCSYFIAQALQLHEGEEPDWGAHWSAGFYIQIVLFVVCNLTAFLCWSLPAYRPMAALLHVASIGLLIDCPNQISLTKLRRELNYRALRLTQIACTLVTVVSSIALALAGAGAMALIIGSNVLHGIPLAIYLLFIAKWRPRTQWWQWPNWGEYVRPLRFGAQLSGSAMLGAARGMLEAAVLPATIGYNNLGLLNRAQVIFSTTVGRGAGVVIDIVYPLLPRSAGNPEQFSRHATLFVQTMFFFSIPGAVFVSLEGPNISRLLYGAKWIAADPLILPGTIFAWAVSTILIFTTVLQARNRLKLAFACNLSAAIACLPAIMVAAIYGETPAYIWVLAGGEILAALTGINLCSKLLERKWAMRAVIPPLVASAIGGLVIAMIGANLSKIRSAERLTVLGLIFAAVVLIIVRILFASSFREMVVRMPGRQWLIKTVRL